MINCDRFRGRGVMGSHVTAPIEAKSKINENGRIVIPAPIREQMGLKAGETLFMTVDGDVLRLESHRARVRRVQESMRRHIASGRSLADELIAERREEARRETEDGLG